MSSSSCLNPCSVPTTTFSGTLTTGIQDISALLPLLGTEQCEERVSSALTNGYLYAAATPMSLFGTLGLARAGFKTFLASVNFTICGVPISGAITLSDMGFQPQGENLSLIMADTEKKGRYVVESRLDTLLEELHLDETRIIDVSHKTKAWNIYLVALTGLLSSISITPYIFLNPRVGSSFSPFTRWSFPVLRAVGGFLTSTMIQFTLQKRITTITKAWLLERIHRKKHHDVGQEQTAAEDERSWEGDNRDAEKGLGDTGLKRNTTDGVTWFLLFWLFLGDVASVVGYVGCFSVVQSANSSNGPVIWLGLEVALSLLRFFLWGLNPKMDDAPPLEFVLKLNDDPPLLSCNQSNEQILRDGVLPLTRASPFLNPITAFSGVVKRFGRPGLNLYYTLTRANILSANERELQPSAHKRFLYITIFDHEERTTRVFTRDGPTDYIYSAGQPDVNLEHGLLETKLGTKFDIKNDPILGDGDIYKSLVKHHQSLLRSTVGRAGRNRQYRIGSKWTMKADVILEPDEGTDLGDDEDDYLARDCRYIDQGSIENMRKSLDVKRGKWIETYMRQVVDETREWLQAERASIRNVDEVLADQAKMDGKRKEAGGEEMIERQSNKTMLDNEDMLQVGERWLIEEWRCMEKLLVYEVEEWEAKLWEKAKEFIRSDGVQEKRRVEREWRANCWKRLDDNIRAMNQRMEAAKETNDNLSDAWQTAHRDVRKSWEIAMKRFADGPRPLSKRSRRERLEEDFRISAGNMPFMFWWQEPERKRRQQAAMENRLRKELDDIEFRLSQGLEKCDQFWGGDWLVRARYSRAKWLSIPASSDKTELEFFSRALKTRNHVICIDFWGCNDDIAAEMIRDSPSLTSVYIKNSTRLRLERDIQRDSPLFQNDGDILNFLKENVNQLRLPEAATPRTFIFIHSAEHFPEFSATEIGLRHPALAISFFGPSSGSLTLRLRHRSSRPDATLKLNMIGFPTFKLPIPSTLTTHDITLHPRQSKRLSFSPNSRNNLIIQAETERYWLQDIQLLDEAGHPYNPSPSERLDHSDWLMPTSSSESETSSHSPVSIPSRLAESEMDGISEVVDEMGDVMTIPGVTGANEVDVHSGIEVERR